MSSARSAAPGRAAVVVVAAAASADGAAGAGAHGASICWASAWPRHWFAVDKAARSGQPAAPHRKRDSDCHARRSSGARSGGGGVRDWPILSAVRASIVCELAVVRQSPHTLPSTPPLPRQMQFEPAASAPFRSLS
eukprot:366205-Chlamydomonas_euryale.AAC.10